MNVIHMMPASLPLLVLMMIPVTGIVAGVGLFIGWMTVTVLRTTGDGIVVDSLLAPVAFWIAFWVAMVLPWHGSYVEVGWTYYNQFPHPMAWAVGAACLGPVVHQVVRHRRRKANKIRGASPPRTSGRAWPGLRRPPTSPDISFRPHNEARRHESA